MEPQQPERFQIWWAAPFAGFVALILLGVFVGKPTPTDAGTSYDPSDTGYRGFYQTLEELGYPVQRARRLEGTESVRWVLSPRVNEKAAEAERKSEADRLLRWVDQGGRLILTTSNATFAGDLGLQWESRALQRPEELRTARLGNAEVRIKPGKERVEYPGARGQSWGTVDDKPLATIVRRGKGEIWLVHYPELFANEWIGQGDNAIVVCRLAEATLSGQPGPVTVDEYFHGLRERPGMIELLFSPPILWITLAAILLLFVLLWRNIPRFGPLRLAAPLTRRSKEEFLDAMALLLQRKGNRADALNSVRDSLLVEMARQLGLPGDADAQTIAQEAARQRALNEVRLMSWLAGRGVPGGDRPLAFVEALRELESIRNDFFSLSGAR